MFNKDDSCVSTIIQRYKSRGYRLTLLCLIVISIVAMIFIARTQFESIFKQDESIYLPIILNEVDNVKIDENPGLRERMAYVKHSLGVDQKNKKWHQEIQRFLSRTSPYFQNRSICGDYWLIVFQFSKILQETAKLLPNWCILVVMVGDDSIGPVTPNVFRLTGVIQRELAQLSLFYKESLLLPNDLYTVRKNLGYLWAIFHQATVIWDFDHINEILINRTVLPFPLRETINALIISNYNRSLFNPYSCFRSNIHPLWPRGYPFRSLKDSPEKSTSFEISHRQWPTKNLAVIHSLVEGYTKFNSEYRLVKPNLPLLLSTTMKGSITDAKLVVPPRVFSPYDQQTTFHLQSALWALFLPTTVKQQASDSVRSYAMQRLMWDVGLQTAFAGTFLHKRYPYIDIQTVPLGLRKSDKVRSDEKVFYWKIHKLIHLLTEWKTTENNFTERIEQLFVALHEHGHIKMYDLYLLQLWLQELYQIGYVFPTIIS